MSPVFSILGEEFQYAAHSLKYRFFGSRARPENKILVNGSPKTGTTWMYRMLASIPGYHFIGNFNGDIQRYHQTPPGSVIHGHDACTPDLIKILHENQIKVVLMLRDPRDQVVSRVFHFRRSHNDRWHNTFIELSDVEAIMACIEGRPGLRSVNDLIGLTQSWLDSEYEILCIKYEDLSLKPLKEFQRVIHYAGINIDHRLASAIVTRNRFERLTIGKKIWKRGRKAGQENSNSHFRKGIIGDWKNYFNEQHKERFKEIAGQKLIEMGYETGFDW